MLQGTLVDNVRRAAAEKFADVAHLHQTATAYSDSLVAHRGVGGDIAEETHTHSFLPLDAPPTRVHDTRRFYEDCVFDFLPQQDDRQPAKHIAPVRTATKSSIENALEDDEDDQESSPLDVHVNESLKDQMVVDAGSMSGSSFVCLRESLW